MGVREVLLRPTVAQDAKQVADVLLAARAEMMSYLPRPHSDGETRAWTAEVVLPGSRVWVAERDGRIERFASLNGSTLDHLYGLPGRQGVGTGAALCELASRESPDRLTPNSSRVASAPAPSTSGTAS